MTITQLVDSIKKANYFYRIGEAIMSDTQYDKLVDKLVALDPDNELLKQIGFAVNDRKIELPITMASMNKVKTCEELLDWFRLKSIDPNVDIIITPKYDGLSLCVSEKHQIAYTRGDGRVGQLSTPHYELMQGKFSGSNISFTFGEAIMPKEVFEENWSQEFANARNLVSGLFNSKKPSDALIDCVYIKYGAVGHDYKFKSDLLDALNKGQHWQVAYKLTKISLINDKMITELFKEWSSNFEIDGLIIEINDLNLQNKLGRETSTNNPVWARALKHKIFEQSATTTVKDIVWNISKQGYLKPTIKVDPISLDGVVISNVTGNNARWVKEMGIGIGSEVVIVRSGMVIPVITQVNTKKPFIEPEGAEWNENEVELVTIRETDDQIVKRIVSFFQILETKGVSEGIIRQLLQHPSVKYTNFKTALKAIFDLSIADIKEIYRFGEKKANNTWNAIRESCESVDVAKLQHATGVFENLGSRKLALLKHFQRKPSVEEVMQIDGFAEKSASIYVNNWLKFYNFISELPITISYETEEQEDDTVSNDLDGLSFCFTGIRMPEAEAEIKSRGGNIASGVTKTTTHLVCKDPSAGSSKLQKARTQGVSIITVLELEKMLG